MSNTIQGKTWAGVGKPQQKAMSITSTSTAYSSLNQSPQRFDGYSPLSNQIEAKSTFFYHSHENCNPASVETVSGGKLLSPHSTQAFGGAFSGAKYEICSSLPSSKTSTPLVSPFNPLKLQSPSKNIEPHFFDSPALGQGLNSKTFGPNSSSRNDELDMNGFQVSSFDHRKSANRPRGISDPISRTSHFPLSGRNNENVLRQEKPKRALLDVNILSRLTKFLRCPELRNLSQVFKEFRRTKAYKQIFKLRVKELLLKGLRYEEQHDFWNHFLNWERLKRQYSFDFSNLCTRETHFFKDIEKDLDRTLPEYDRYSTEEGKRGLLRVLTAVANKMRSIGYVQGLNSIAGTLLFYLKEDDSFWMTIFMLQKLNVKAFLKDNLERMHVLTYQFRMFLENYLPEIANYFDENDISVDYFTTTWFITMFSHSLALPSVIKLWNFVFIRGTTFLVQFALAVFAKYKSTIVNTEFDDLGHLIKTKLKDLREDDSIFSLALTFKVANRLLSEAELFYDHGQPRLCLQSDELGKLQWRIRPTARVPQSLNDLSLNEIEEEAEHLTISRENSEKKDTVVGSLVSMITVDLPGTFKKIFSKGKSMKNVQITTKSSQELDFGFDSRLTRASSTINSQSLRVLSIPELDVQRSERKQLDESFDFKDSQMLSSQPLSVSTPRNLDGFKMSLNRPSLPQKEDAHSQLHMSIKNSAMDRLSNKALADSPMLQKNPLSTDIQKTSKFHNKF